jgi:hypothetical protein
VSTTHDVTSEELDLILEAIARHPKGASEIMRPPGEVYSIAAPIGRYIYVNFARPLDLPLGATYRTWIAHVIDGQVARVMYFRSRRGAHGDDTLPNDE